MKVGFICDKAAVLGLAKKEDLYFQFSVFVSGHSATETFLVMQYKFEPEM